LNRHFSKEDVKNHLRAHKMMLNITNLGNINKTTVRYHLTPVRMANIKKQQVSVGENVEKMHCWWEYKLVQSRWKLVWRFLKKLK